MRKINLFIFVLLLHVSTLLKAQNENNKWYFGSMAGLDFSTSPPTVLTNGAMSAFEGCASISDASGNLLFYTDGLLVWNKLHQVMPNGTGLMGNSSTTQSGIIAKQPGSATLFYVFTQDDVAGQDGFRYSIVDMSLAGGLGDVTTKNTLLHVPSCEKITAARHCNGKDVWVISHDYNSDQFRTYLITSTGINSTPVISAAGPVVAAGNSSVNTLGQMKISPDGQKLGLVIYNTSGAENVEVYDFDASTGAVSNPLILGSYENLYGCEFSQNSHMFYAGIYQMGPIFQWDLCAPTSSAVIASQYTLNTLGGLYGSLQLAPDGKIYIAKSGDSLLPVINSPNLAGAACNYVEKGIDISPKQSALGLPNFVNNFVPPVSPPFTYSAGCSSANLYAPGTQTVVNGCYSTSYSILSVLWNFGDPASANNNTSAVINPTHTYPAIGTYTVKVIVNYKCSTDTLIQPVTLGGVVPQLTITGTTAMCEGDKRKITVSGAHYYHWSTGEGAPGILVSPAVSHTYSVKGSNTITGCEATKVITLTVLPCTGIETTPYENAKVTIFPNPTKGTLRFDAEEPLKVEIFDPLGTLIYTRQIPEGEFTADLTTYNAGIYMVRFTGEHSAKVVRVQKVE